VTTLDPLVVDAYALSYGGRLNIQALVAAGYPWSGVFLKATEGTYYPRGAARDWFLENWLPARIHALDRYGVSWFRGAYHYLRVDEDGTQQAEAFLELIAEAGGLGPGDLLMVDLESAENPVHATRYQIITCVSDFTTKIKVATGRPTILYGNNYPYEHGVTQPMGCTGLCVADYEATLPPVVYHRLGWDIQATPPAVWGWQYCGDPDGGKLAGYPKTSPIGPGPADIIAIIANGGGQAGIDWTRANLLGKP